MSQELTDSMIAESVTKRVGDGGVLHVLSNEWFIQEDGRGWDTEVAVDGAKFTETFGGSPDEVEDVRWQIEGWLKEDYPDADDVDFYVFDIIFDEEDEPRYA